MTFWEGKSVAVTGAGSGIGKALSKEMAARGAKVWLSDINGAAAQAVAQEIGGDATATPLDVTDVDAVKAHIDAIKAAHGSIDAIFNNAGIGVGGDMRDLDVAGFDYCIDVNIRGVVNGVMAAWPHMVAQRSGVIVNTASAAGLAGVPLLAPYAMAKHAVVGLSKSTRFEGAEHNISVCALCPMAIETPILDPQPPQGHNMWVPNIRDYLTKFGGAPYPVDKFASYALDQVERNKGIIVAPRGARLRIALGKLIPGMSESVTRKVYREMLATRPND